MDDCIVRYNINYKRFPFGILLKSETINPIVEPIKKDIIDQKMAVTIFQ